MIAAAIIVLPGSDTALTIRNTLSNGFVAGQLTALGVGVGQTIWFAASSAGLATLLRASATLYDLMRFGGAALLIYFGLVTVWQAGSHRVLRMRVDAGANQERSTNNLLALFFAQGLTSNLGNPKMLFFFSGLLPEFAGDSPTLQTNLLLSGVFVSLSLGWLTLCAFLAGRAHQQIGRASTERLIQIAAGIVLIVLGVYAMISGCQSVRA